MMKFTNFFRDSRKGYQAAEDDKSSKTVTPNSGRKPWQRPSFRSVHRYPERSNFYEKLARREEVAMAGLFWNNSIAMRPTVKGSGSAALDAKDYEDGSKKEVDECSGYSHIEIDLTWQTSKKVPILLRKLERTGIITKKLGRYITMKTLTAGKL